MMKTRGVNGSLNVQAIVDSVYENVGDGRDYACAAGRTENHANLAVFQDDGRCHARERALAGGDGIGRALKQTEHIRYARLRGEVVHFVVEKETESGGGDA